MNDKPNICVTYRRQKYNKWVALWDRWKPLDLHIKPWQYWKGNMNLAGNFWSGLRTNITLWSPFLNKIINWKYRNMRLEIPYKTKDTLCVVKGGKQPSTDSN